MQRGQSRSKLRSAHIAQLRALALAIPASGSVGGEYRQTVIAAFESSERAHSVASYLRQHAEVPAESLRVASPSEIDDDGQCIFVPKTHAQSLARIVATGRSAVIITLDETEVHNMRELLEDELKSLSTIVLPPERREGDRRGAKAESAADGRPDLLSRFRAAAASRVRGLLGTAGPGVIAGGAANDPATITAYSVVGAQYGLALNWLVVLFTPLLIVVQQMSAHLANVTKTDLAALIRTHYGRSVATFAVLITIVVNIVGIGADLVMLCSVAQLLTSIRYIYFVVPVGVGIVCMTFFLDYKRVSKYLLWLVGISVAYMAAAVLTRPNWGQVLFHSFVPNVELRSGVALGAVGLLGACINPYLFFWQASGEIEERRGIQGIRRGNTDVVTGMIWSNAVALFTIIAMAGALGGHQVQITNPADAAQALEPIAGRYATALFSVGILGAGLLGIPILAASTAYSAAGLLGWRRSLARQPGSAPQFYVVLGAAILIGVEIAISGINPIRALFYSQVLNGFIAPVLIVLLVLLTSQRKVMGDFVSGRWARLLGWAAAVLLVIADAKLVYDVASRGFP
jgi:Mn2+/Fe2+ NRAMP family transporter